MLSLGYERETELSTFHTPERLGDRGRCATPTRYFSTNASDVRVARIITPYRLTIGSRREDNRESRDASSLLGNSFLLVQFPGIFGALLEIFREKRDFCSF